jgi:hypothetical protein
MRHGRGGMHRQQMPHQGGPGGFGYENQFEGPPRYGRGGRGGHQGDDYDRPNFRVSQRGRGNFNRGFGRGGGMQRKNY